MSLKITDRFPGGNVRVLKVLRSGDVAEVEFAHDPRGGGSALWFDFRMTAVDKDPARQPKELVLVLRFFGDGAAKAAAAAVRPVMREQGKNWSRLKPPDEKVSQDGMLSLSWRVPFPGSPSEVAFCFPYGAEDHEGSMGRGKGYWDAREIGLTQGGRIIERAYNGIYKGCSACPNPHGLYIVAREGAGETPGSWVLEGMMEAFSRAKPVNWCVWAVPFADLDGVESGAPAPVHRRGQGIHPPHRDFVVGGDVRRWSERCKPELVLDLVGTAAGESDGVFAYRGVAGDGDAARNTETWANIIGEALKPEYVAESFLREGGVSQFGGGPGMGSSAAGEIGCAALAVALPYAQIRGLVLLQKQYKEIGQRMARAIIGRWGRG